MEQTVNLEMTKDEAAQFSAIIEQCLQRIQESNEASDARMARIDKLQAETQAMLNQIKEVLHVEAIF